MKWAVCSLCPEASNKNTEHNAHRCKYSIVAVKKRGVSKCEKTTSNRNKAAGCWSQAKGICSSN